MRVAPNMVCHKFSAAGAIRLADERDEPDILALCKLMHDEQHPYPLSWDKIVSNIRKATRHERGIIGLIGERGTGLPRGAVFLLIDQPWYSESWILLEYFNYVHPAHRRSTYAHDLIEYSKRCAQDLRIDLTIGVYSTIRTEAKVRLYRRQVACAGAFFIYQPPNRYYDQVAAE